MIELSKSNNLRRADMSYENAPVELTHGHYYTCGGLPAGSREAEGDLKQTLKAVADRKSTRLNSSHNVISRMPSSA